MWVIVFYGQLISVGNFSIRAEIGQNQGRGEAVLILVYSIKSRREPGETKTCVINLQVVCRGLSIW